VPTVTATPSSLPLIPATTTLLPGPQGPIPYVIDPTLLPQPVTAPAFAPPPLPISQARHAAHARSCMHACYSRPVEVMPARALHMHACRLFPCMLRCLADGLQHRRACLWGRRLFWLPKKGRAAHAQEDLGGAQQVPSVEPLLSGSLHVRPPSHSRTHECMTAMIGHQQVGHCMQCDGSHSYQQGCRAAL
jgi:hypothetical protein